MFELTKRQYEILQYLRKCQVDGHMPTIREIAEHFRFRSLNAVHDHLAALERKGYIERTQRTARGIELAPDLRDDPRGIPIIGRVAAGQPIMAIENIDSYLSLETIYDRESHYALRVYGDSMTGAGIFDGDFAIVRHQSEIANGEIGVAIVDGEATIKRIRRNGHLVLLIAENEKYSPVEVDLRRVDFRIGGKVVGVHRILS